MITSVLGVFHRFCKSARSTHRQNEINMACLHGDGSAIQYSNIFGVRLPVCPVTKMLIKVSVV